VGAPLLEGSDPMPRFVDLCLAHANLQRRASAEMRAHLHQMVWRQAADYAALAAESCLVHGDFSRRNLLVRCVAGEWRVAGVLDWEFAISGTPLTDFGNFLRYEPWDHAVVEPHFSAGYREAGGELPEDWRRLLRLVDVIAICESLTNEGLPETAADELVGLISAC
jgi:aminoglycoside phosphotransferase (APT) family kinase protein